MILLKYFSLYGTSFKEEVLEKFILPQMLIGLRETDDRIVAATFSALAVMVPILGADVVVGGERKKHFIEGRPKFSTSDSLPPISTVPVTEKKISNIGPTNLRGVIDIENKLSPLKSNDTKASTRSSEDKLRKQDREKRRQDMEKRKEERKKDLERRRREREKEKATKQSSPRRLLDLVIPDVESDHEEFEPCEDLDEAQSSPPSDSTSRRSSQATADHNVQYWSDDHSVTSEHDKLDMTNVDFTYSSSQAEKFNTTSFNSRNKDSSISKSTQGNALKLGFKKSLGGTDKSKPSKSRHQSDEPPGSEFEITRVVTHSSEPDYFADMEPVVSFKAKDSKGSLLQSHTGRLSSKLAMVEDTSEVESGWADEWEGFE